VYRPSQIILGESGSGKTCLAKIFARDKVARGLHVGILDPAFEDWPPGVALATNRRAEFFDWVARNYHLRKFLIIDESGTAVGKVDAHADFLATTGRHLGAASVFVAHRLEVLSRIVQSQSRTRWIFGCDVKDAKQLADNHSRPELLTAADLPPLHFFRVAPFSPLMRGKLAFRRGIPFVQTLEVVSK
jgi:hypothetical protein